MSETGPISAVALLRSDGAALLQLRDDKPLLMHAGLWVFPGGHAEVGEEPAACAQRELEEETAYRADRLDHLAALHDPKDGAPSPVQLFAAEWDGRQSIECREGRELRWISRDEAAGLPMPEFLRDAWDEHVLPYFSTHAKTNGGAT